MNGLTALSKEAYLKAAPKLKDEMMFDALTAIDKRLKNIESRKLLFTVSSFAGGVVGGIGTVATWAWFKFSSGGG